ncbi:VOC family protein [Salinirubellus salinus]|uniref:VOC family protein n=1 Tax=Salinirubellus salinus TaxID=1364945 RepID=A0A9E7R0D1_9EURY|nr:VOC family protein [Salinirubellus salinus]UWM53307.1 VOC family protein [Salinirubellus salinus]
MDLRLDHVTVAGRSLDALDAAFSGVGLDPTYGGTHSNGVTHMSTLPFPDGTYLECISTREAGAASPWWDAHIRTDAGPCAWCVRVPDAGEAAETLRDRGVAVDGPHEFARERPDGTRLAWELVYLGGGEPGAVLPFCIADTTPREWRVGDPRAGTGVTGIETVVVGVPTLEAASERLRAAFDLGAPTADESERLGARVARFPDAPVALAAPLGDGWLAERLETVGASPCAYLFEAEAGVTDRYPVLTREPWGEREAAWLDPDGLGGLRHLGLVEGA